MPNITLIAADDHQLFLEGLGSLFSSMVGLTLLKTCNNGDDLLQLAQQYTPDIVLLDLSMPGADTETIIHTLETRLPQTKLIALTMCFDYTTAQNLLALGLSGYVLKDAAFHELETAIHQVYAGDEFVSTSLIHAIRDASDTVDTLLTSKEKAILTDVAQGHKNHAIAEKHFITERTVRFHLANCCIKLDANGRTHAVAKALSLNLITI